MTRGDKIASVVFGIACGGATAWNWSELLLHGRYYPKLAFFGPLGLLLILLPFTPAAEEDQSKLTNAQRLELFLLGMVFVGLGALNAWLMAHWGR